MQPSSHDITQLRVAAVQCPLGDSAAQNVERLCGLIDGAIDPSHGKPAPHVICLPELLESPYFCISQDPAHFELARPLDGHPTVKRFAELAKRHRSVIAVPFFEADGPHYYNSVAVLDADGQLLRNSAGSLVYRKSHIPQGPGYEEKFYFSPGNTGAAVWPTRYGCIGVGICWDQWFPELARMMVLQGAQVLLYPTAIGSEPSAPELDTQKRWELVMRGHAAANSVPVVAANRCGLEGTQRFYGSSFISNLDGTELLASLGRDQQGMIQATLSLPEIRADRAVWGHFRDRRTDLYRPLLG